MKRTVIRIGPRDSAVIFHADGAQEVIVPDQHPQSIANASALNALRTAILFRCPEALRLVDLMMEQERANSRTKQ